MKQVFEIYRYKLDIPSFQHFLALPNNQLLTSNNNKLTLFSSKGEILFEFQFEQQVRGLIHLTKREIVIKSLNEITHYDLDKRQKISSVKLAKDSKVSFIGHWNGGFYYIMNNKLISNGSEISVEFTNQKIIETTNLGNLIIYNQLNWNADSPLVHITLSDEDESPAPVISFYSIGSPFSFIIVKIMETAKSFIMFANSIEGTIFSYSKTELTLTYVMSVENNIIDVLDFEEQLEMCLLLTVLHHKNPNSKVLMEPAQQCLKIVNLRKNKQINEIYLPQMRYSFADNIFFGVFHGGIYGFKFLHLGRTYINLMTKAGYEKLYGQQIIQKVRKVLL